MKKLLLMMSIITFALTSCSNDDSKEKELIPEKEATIEKASVKATDRTTWHYISLKEGKVIGSSKDSEKEDWTKKTTWDLAICRYKIRTNSGDATTVNAKGGVFICNKSIKFNALNKLPQNCQFQKDKKVTTHGMGGKISISVQSEAGVIVMKKDEDGNTIMPPVYLPAPVYIFQSADGTKHYKVLFTQYKDENGISGNVKFDLAELK